MRHINNVRLATQGMTQILPSGFVEVAELMMLALLDHAAIHPIAASAVVQPHCLRTNSSITPIPTERRYSLAQSPRSHAARHHDSSVK